MKTKKRYTSRPLLWLLVIFFGCDVSEISNTESGSAATLSLAAGTSHTGTTATEYEIIDLGTLGGDISQAFGINDQGQVVGLSITASGEEHAFLWDEIGGMQDLGTLGGPISQAFGINDQGQVVGESTTASGVNRAFLWDEAGGMQDLLGTQLGVESQAFAINDLGQVAGKAGDGSTFKAFFWDGGPLNLGTLGGISSEAFGINDQGQVVGQSRTASGEIHAFLWDETGGMQDLGTLGGSISQAFGINDQGQVVGSSLTASGEEHAFLWDEIGGMQDLGTLGGPISRASGINDQGQVVGSSLTALNETHLFLWDETGGMQDLGPLGGFSSVASGINDQGQVVGYISSTFSVETNALLWNPVEVETNSPPVANAGPDQTLGCAGTNNVVTLSQAILYGDTVKGCAGTNTNNVVTLDGSGSGDPDGDDLTYSWSLDGTEIATGVNPQIELEDGSYVITLTVTDPAGESSTDEVVITIADTQAPVISYSVEADNLWPPNHKMRLAVTGITASDVCDPNPLISIVVASNEPVNGRGDGNTDQDWQVADNGDGSYQVYLRAERSGRGAGRIYTITITAEDALGNSSQEIVEVNVAHDRGRKAKK